MAENLHLTDKHGMYVGTEDRDRILDKLQEDSYVSGDAPFAVPAIYVLLTTLSNEIRIVQRGNKKENPFKWDKSAGGHVKALSPYDPMHWREECDRTLKEELKEELGVEVLIAVDAIHYRQSMHSGQPNLTTTAVVRLIDYDPWCPSVRTTGDGRPPWLKRHNVAIYSGVYDGLFTFTDKEAQGELRVPKSEAIPLVRAAPSVFAEDLRYLLPRYYYLIGYPEAQQPDSSGAAV